MPSPSIAPGWTEPEAAAARSAPVVMELRGIGKSFLHGATAGSPVLAGVNITLREGEIVGLLGRSGSGKSTVLRIAAGLIAPSEGQVLYQGRILQGPTEGLAVVFQTFALYPWLTVLQNVELGLDALSLPATEARRRALGAIDLIGLDGFQSAFPRELSGGMRQRVGFARALVSDPLLLLMDEPFSALDVLTAETLRTDFLDLWVGQQLPTRSVLLVTHNIEEAVVMCDRILLLSGKPAHVAAEIVVPLPRPRDRLDAAFNAIMVQIYTTLMARLTAETSASTHGNDTIKPLPNVSVSRITGLTRVLAAPPYGGRAELAAIAASRGLQIKEVFSIGAALHLLEFAELAGGTIKLTAAGKVLADSTADERKRLFREHLQCFVPFAAHINQVLKQREDHQAPRERFELELEDHLQPSEAQQTLRTLIGWGRYAELFSYRDDVKSFSLT
jgi:NitT/TauT family transport system ATP-binding protein